LSILKVLKVGEDAAIVVVLGTMHAHAITIKLNISPLCLLTFNLKKLSDLFQFERQVSTQLSRENSQFILIL